VAGFCKVGFRKVVVMEGGWSFAVTWMKIIVFVENPNE
jgi:hypothetical protein